MLLRKTVIPRPELEDELRVKVDTIKARCRDLYMRLQRGHPLLRGLPIANKIMAAIAEHLRSEFHLLLSLLYGVLVDLARVERFTAELRDGRVIAHSGYEMYLLL